MPGKLTKEIFVKRAIEKHGDKYDYSKVEYKNATTKVCIICKEDGHEEFYQLPNSHLRGQGCPECGGVKRLDTSSFIKKAKQVHNDLYDYSNTVYTGASNPVTIGCKRHGDFSQTARVHLRGSGCPSCSSRVSTTLGFIDKAQIVHGNKYDYSKTVYTNYFAKLIVTCKIHGDFTQRAGDHLNGCGCKKCSKLDTKKFIDQARAIHGDTYDYKDTVYVSSTEELTIGCRIHGNFKQLPNTHLRGSGCFKCNRGFSIDSKISLLDEEDLANLTDHQILELLDSRVLPADFKVLTRSASGSKDRKDDINKLRESIGSGTEDETADEVGEQILQEEQLEFEDAQTIAADDQSDNLLNILPDLVTKELKTYDKYFVSSGEKGAYLLKESVNKIWNCVLSSESYLETVKEMRESSGPWLTYVLDTFMMEYKSVLN